MAKRKTETLKAYRKRRGKGNKWKSIDPIEYMKRKRANRAKQN